MYQPTITNDQINELPTGHFPGHVLIVDNDSTMAEAEHILSRETLVGYDTETRPSFEKGIRHGMSLVQISTADTALLFRVKHAPLSAAIRQILSSSHVIKVGAALRDDLRGMRQVAEFCPAGFVDLQTLIRQWGIEEISVKKMAAIVLGIKISKAQRLTNWDAVRLTPPQQDYAAMDAWVCREIYLSLRSDNPQLMDQTQSVLLRQQPEGPLPGTTPKQSRSAGGHRRNNKRRYKPRKPTTPHDTDHPTDTPAR